MEGRGGFHSNFPLLFFLLLALALCSCLFKSPVGKAHILPAFRRGFLHRYHHAQPTPCQRGLAGGSLPKPGSLPRCGLAWPRGLAMGAVLGAGGSVAAIRAHPWGCDGVLQHPKLPPARSWGCRPQQKHFPKLFQHPQLGSSSSCIPVSPVQLGCCRLVGDGARSFTAPWGCR